MGQPLHSFSCTFVRVARDFIRSLSCCLVFSSFGLKQLDRLHARCVDGNHPRRASCEGCSGLDLLKSCKSSAQCHGHTTHAVRHWNVVGKGSAL